MVEYKWEATQKDQIPMNAFRGGYDGQLELFVARARNPADKRLTGGKAARTLKHGCQIPYDGKEVIVADYDVLTIPSQYRKNLVWEFCKRGDLPNNAIPTDDAATLYIARIAHNNTLTVGKFQFGLQVAHIGWGNKEYSYENYEILCYYN